MKEETKKLALSNSQLEYHKTDFQNRNIPMELLDYITDYGYLGCYIDKLTIVGNMTDRLKNILLHDYSCEIKYHHSDYFTGQLFEDADENFYLEYNLEKAQKMKISNFRLEFNPRISRKDQMDFIFKLIVPNLNNIGISRIDIAFDYERDLSGYVIDKPMGKRFYYGKDNKLETVYWGSPKSEFQIRMYDKYKERKKKGTDVEILHYGSYDCYWRMEFQLNGSKFIEKQIKNNFHILQETKVTKRNYSIQDLSAQEQIMLYAKDNAPSLYSNLGKMSKAKYNKLARDISDVDLSDGFRTAILDIEYCYDVPQKVSLVDFCNKILFSW